MRLTELVEEAATYANVEIDGEVETVFVLSGALPGRRRFVQAFEIDEEVYYRAAALDGASWQLGRARLVAGNALLPLDTWRSTGAYGTAAVAFDGPVVVTAIAPAAAMLATGSATHGSSAHGPGAVAAGGGHANGEGAVAIGSVAHADGDFAVALGREAFTEHRGAVVVGAGTQSWAEWCEFYGAAWRWSGRGVTYNDESVDLLPGYGDVVLTVPPGLAVVGRVMVVGQRDEDGGFWSGECAVVARHIPGAGLEIVGGGVLTPIAASSGAEVSAELIAGGVGDQLIVRAHGEFGDVWRWSAVISGTAVAGTLDGVGGGDVPPPPPPGG